MSELIPLVLLVINSVFSILISMPYVVNALSSWLTYLVSSKFVIVLSPMLTDLSWSFKVSVMILSRKMLKRVSESRHHCLTPNVVLIILILIYCAGDFAVEALYDFNQVGIDVG